MYWEIRQPLIVQNCFGLPFHLLSFYKDWTDKWVQKPPRRPWHYIYSSFGMHKWAAEPKLYWEGRADDVKVKPGSAIQLCVVKFRWCSQPVVLWISTRVTERSWVGVGTELSTCTSTQGWQHTDDCRLSGPKWLILNSLYSLFLERGC